MNTVTANLADLRNEIAPCKPVIIAVTKYFGTEKLVEAYEAGLRNFAENRVADALEKFGNLPEEIKQNSTFHLIGHLQTNKVKKAVGHFDLIQHFHDVTSPTIKRNGYAPGPACGARYPVRFAQQAAHPGRTSGARGPESAPHRRNP